MDNHLCVVDNKHSEQRQTEVELQREENRAVQEEIHNTNVEQDGESRREKAADQQDSLL